MKQSGLSHQGEWQEILYFTERVLRDQTERIVIISKVYDMLYRFHFIVNYFLGFAAWRFASF